MTVLALQSISGGYGETEILHDVSLQVEAGEIVVIIGPNGAGKSTALKAVLGLLNLSGGRIILAGQNITGTPPERVVQHGVCYVPQTENVFPSLTVEENLEMGGFIRNDDLRPRISEIYRIFPPLKEKRKQPAGTLSGGQRQMVAMGKALMLEPVILLLDEPSAGLSPKYRSEIFKIIKDIHQTGTPILMVEQNAREALRIASRAYILVDGQNRIDGPGRELLVNQDVARMFLGAAVENNNNE
jgi:branched-chain amino acid transport system ATP-binding protein